MIPNEMVPGVVLALSLNMGALIRNVCRLFAKVWFLKCGECNFPFSFWAIMWKPWGWAMLQTVRNHNNGPVCTHAIQNVWAYFGNMRFHAASPLERVLIHQILDILLFFFFLRLSQHFNLLSRFVFWILMTYTVINPVWNCKYSVGSCHSGFCFARRHIFISHRCLIWCLQNGLLSAFLLSLTDASKSTENPSRAMLQNLR